jgi:hypothetical protein
MSSFSNKCKEDGKEHRLIVTYTPQTNGMLVKVNGTIKNATDKANNTVILKI